nr:MAG TPA: Replication associated protein [Microviridae sp.]
MKYSPELLKAVDHCQHRSFITNKYTGKRIAVDCGQCDYCIHKRAQKASMRVKTAGSAFEHCWFVTLTYDNEHIPLFNCEVYYSEYDDVLSDSGNKVFGYERHSYIPVSDYQPEDSSLLCHIFFTQVQGTVPFDREFKKYVPVTDNWFLSMDAIRSFIRKTQAVNNSVYPAAEQYGLDNLIPFLNYVDVQNYIKRLRKHLNRYTNEKISFYAVGEYGPVHFRPHFHLLLFFNSKKIADVIRECHSKSWKLGRSDIQRSNGGCSSYVASYVNSLASAPSLYRSCRSFKPRSRASLGFFEKGETFDESEDVYAQIETKIDSVLNGREYNFNGVVVKSTPPLSYIRSLLPRFSGTRYDDAVAIHRVISAVGTAPKRIARFGIIDYDSDSILSIVRAYYKYITLNHILTDDDKIVLHNARCLTRFVNSSSDVDVEYFINKLYRLFLHVAKFLRNWHLPGIGDDLYPYAARINFIIKTGIDYEKKADYVRMCDSLRIQETCEFPLLRYFYLPASGCERSIVKEEKDGTFSDYTIRDVMAGIKPTVLYFDDPRKLLLSPALSRLVGSSFKASQPANYNDLCDDLQRCLYNRASKFCRDMIKHKKLNDANNIFNRMV